MTNPDGRRGFYTCLARAALTLAVYSPVIGFDFVNLDDQLYVYENPNVRAGFTPEGIRWAFTSLDANIWHPLTWLSHMLDWQLFGPNASGHHATGLLLHVACTLLLFMALSRMTDRFWESAAVAALFALHPLHVESVAWVSERKDVLSTFFFILTLLAYPRYAENRSAGRALAVIIPYALGLMAKPMLVTVPFLLLLLDVWPLRRFGETGLRWAAAKPLVIEKIPLVLLAVPAGIMAVVAQDRGAALATMDLVPLELRLSNAAVGAVTYLWKTVWPVELAVHYPLGPVDAGIAIGAALILCLLTALAFLTCRRYPYVTVGWLWYLLTLAPVCGIVQVGCHSMADRYTYIPLIGIFIIAAWGIPELFLRIHSPTLDGRGTGRATAVIVAVLLLSMAALTGYQLQFWRDSETLFRRALAVTGPSGVAENNLATALISRGACEEALPHILRAVELRPTDEEVVFNAGNALAGLRRDDEAKGWFEKAIGMNPRFSRAYTNLGALLVRQQKFDEAILKLEAAEGLNPGCSLTRLNLAVALARTGRTKEAAARLEEAVRLAPDSLLLRTKVVQTYWLMGLRDRSLGHNDFIRGMDGNLAGEITRWMETRKAVD
jgi:Flp pilus assembly protein TadD